MVAFIVHNFVYSTKP